jgi:hypothetical protein
LDSTATDLDSAVSSVEFVAHPWIARGVVTLFVSAPGLGKTQIAVDISKRFLSPELKWFDDQPLDVPADSVIVWYDTESFQGALKELFGRREIDKDRVILPFPDPLQEVQSDKHIGHLGDVLLEVDASLLIVDSLRGSHKNKENDSDMQRLLSDLSKVVQRYNICCLVIHHTNKPAPGMPDAISSIHRVRGSSAIAAQCRIVWALDDPNPGSGYLRLQMIKNNLAKQADPVGVKIMDEGVEWDLKSPEQPKLEKKKSRVNEALAFLLDALGNGPCPQKEIEEKADREGISEMTLRRAADNCVAKEKEKGEKGRWMWSLKGINLGDVVGEL